MSDIFEEEILDTKVAVNGRIAAAVIDYVLIISLTLVFIVLFGKKTAPQTYVVTGWMGLVPIYFWFFYFIIIEYLFKGSLGNLLAGLKIVSMDNSSLRFMQVVKRRIADILDIWWCFGLLGYYFIRTTKNNQRIGDLWANTIVISRRG